MRHDYQQFVRRQAVVAVIGPDSADAFRQFWREHEMPLVGLADPDHHVANLYGQRVRLLRWGRLPSVLLVDKTGRMHFRHDGETMQDIPPNSVLLDLLDALNASPGNPAPDSGGG